MLTNISRRLAVITGLLAAVVVPVAVGAAHASTAPRTGTAAVVAAHPSPSPTKKARIYSMIHTAANVPVRSGPSTRSTTIVRTLKKAGGKVTLTCYVSGQAVGGNTTWYRTAGTPAGYISGFYLHSGHRPAPRVPHC